MHLAGIDGVRLAGWLRAAADFGDVRLDEPINGRMAARCCAGTSDFRPF